MHYLVAEMGIRSSDQTLDAPNGSPTTSTMAQKMPSEGRIGVVVMPCLHRLKKRGHVLSMNMIIISVTVPSAHIPAVLHACNIRVSHQFSVPLGLCHNAFALLNVWSMFQHWYTIQEL